MNDQGYPWVLGRNEVQAGQQIVITGRPDAVASETVLPIMYDKFHQVKHTRSTHPRHKVHFSRDLLVWCGFLYPFSCWSLEAVVLASAA